MAFLYLFVIFVFLLKKYLDKQSEPSTVQSDFFQEKEIKNEENYDQYRYAYLDEVIKCLILCTYDSGKFNTLFYVDSPFRGLEEDLNDLFESTRFEAFLQDHLTEPCIEDGLLHLRSLIHDISGDEWLFETVDTDNDIRWRRINKVAEETLTCMNITARNYDFESGKTY